MMVRVRVRLGLGLCLLAIYHTSMFIQTTESMGQIKWRTYSKGISCLITPTDELDVNA